MLLYLAEAWNLIFRIESIAMIFAGTVLGTVIGAIPGLTATMGMALFSPLTFFMAPNYGIPFLLGLYKGGTYGGSVSAILIGTPGTASNAATVLDGYPMAKKGEAAKALSAALYASLVGDFFGTCVLIIGAPQLAKVALAFGPPELFSLTVFSLTMVAYVSGKSLLKGVISASIGMALAVIGPDPMTGYPRFSFGSLELSAGLEVVPITIGLFGLAEIIIQTEEGVATSVLIERVAGKWVSLKDVGKHIGVLVQSSLIGVGLGALPGIGTETSCWMAYAAAKSRTKHPEEFGTGCLEGVLAPEAGNNSVCGAAMVPMLTFGIPGDVVTAVLLGAFVAQGLRPGPLLFQQAPEILLALFIGMYFATIALYLVGMSMIPVFSQVLKISRPVLYTLVVALCIVGSFAVRNNVFDVLTMLSCGILAYFLRKADFPISPVILGFILGKMLELHLRRSMIMGFGNPIIFVTRPISLFFLVITLLTLLFLKKRRRLFS